MNQRHGLRRQPGVADRADRGDGRPSAHSGAFVYRQRWPGHRQRQDIDKLRLRLQQEYEDTGQPVRGRRTPDTSRVDPAVAPTTSGPLRLLERKIAAAAQKAWERAPVR